MIDGLIHSIQIIAVVVVLILAVFGCAGYYFMKNYRAKVKEKQVDYNKFDRKDTLEYIKFDDVEENMIVSDGKKRFIAGITCTGCDYWDAEADEQLQIIRGTLSFFDVLDNSSIQYWQMARDVNLEKMIKDYKEQLTSLQEKQYLLTLDHEDLKKDSEKEELTDKEYEAYYEKLKSMQREITAIGYQIGQLDVQIQYLESVSGDKADPHREKIYIFDWTYNAYDFTQELTEEEIYEKADKQLRSKANAYMSALQNAGVKSRMLAGVELLEEMRRYTHPISAAKCQVEDIVQSAYNSIAVTSHSLREQEKKVNEDTIKELADEFTKLKEE